MTLEQAIVRAAVLGTEAGAGRATIDGYFEADELIEQFGDLVQDAFNQAFDAAYFASPAADYMKGGAS